MRIAKSIDKSISKTEQYKTLLAQVKSVTESESNRIANLSNICSLLKYEMNWFWVGFYFIENEELVLNTFQGTLACTRIKKGKGVCGKSWETNQTILVSDVTQFEGHIACSVDTQSEIVLPIRDKEKNCIGVLDIDSEFLNTFDEDDKFGLEQITDFINSLL